jgi:uncharacterized protein YndB with AHSA1/START domain
MSERGYTITRRFPYKREQVWQAWTSPEEFAQWFGTEKFEMKDVRFDLRVGGKWSGTMVLPNGAEKFWHGEFVELNEPERLVMTISDEPTDEFERYVVELTQQPKHTEMVLRQEGGNLSDAEYKRAKAGTEEFMDSMLGCLKARHDPI